MVPACMALSERPVLVAPDSFKGTFRATEVAGAVGRGLERAGLMPPDLCPVADGGEGTSEVLLTALGGATAGAHVSDPLGRPVHAGFALLDPDATIRNLSPSTVNVLGYTSEELKGHSSFELVRVRNRLAPET